MNISGVNLNTVFHKNQTPIFSSDFPLMQCNNFVFCCKKTVLKIADFIVHAFQSIQKAMQWLMNRMNDCLSLSFVVQTRMHRNPSLIHFSNSSKILSANLKEAEKNAQLNAKTENISKEWIEKNEKKSSGKKQVRFLDS